MWVVSWDNQNQILVVCCCHETGLKPILLIWDIRLHHFIHLPNCGIKVLAKVPGFCPCVCKLSMKSENALIQMNGAFQMKYFMGTNSAIFHLRIFLDFGKLFQSGLRVLFVSVVSWVFNLQRLKYSGFSFA